MPLSPNWDRSRITQRPKAVELFIVPKFEGDEIFNFVVNKIYIMNDILCN